MLLILNVCLNSTKRSGLVYELFTKSNDVRAVVLCGKKGCITKCGYFPSLKKCVNLPTIYLLLQNETIRLKE